MTISAPSAMQSDSESSTLDSPSTDGVKNFLFHSMSSDLELMKKELNKLIETSPSDQKVSKM